MADSKAQAVREAGPYLLYFNQTLFSHGNITEASLQHDAGYLSSACYDYVRPENLPAVSGVRERYRDMTVADVEREAAVLPWGTADEVIERIVAMSQEMFLEQVHRFGSKVLPALQAHTVSKVLSAE